MTRALLGLCALALLRCASSLRASRFRQQLPPLSARRPLRSAAAAVPGVPDTSGLSLETQSKIAELEVRAAPAATATAACLPLTPAADVADCAQTEKATAVEAEDYDKAKSIKQQIEDLSTPPEPEETEEEKHEKRVLPSRPRPSSRPPAADRGCAAADHR